MILAGAAAQRDALLLELIAGGGSPIAIVGPADSGKSTRLLELLAEEVVADGTPLAHIIALNGRFLPTEQAFRRRLAADVAGWLRSGYEEGRPVWATHPPTPAGHGGAPQHRHRRSSTGLSAISLGPLIHAHLRATGLRQPLHIVVDDADLAASEEYAAAAAFRRSSTSGLEHANPFRNDRRGLLAGKKLSPLSSLGCDGAAMVVGWCTRLHAECHESELVFTWLTTQRAPSTSTLAPSCFRVVRFSASKWACGTAADRVVGQRLAPLARYYASRRPTSETLVALRSPMLAQRCLAAASGLSDDAIASPERHALVVAEAWNRAALLNDRMQRIQGGDLTQQSASQLDVLSAASRLLKVAAFWCGAVPPSCDENVLGDGTARVRGSTTAGRSRRSGNALDAAVAWRSDTYYFSCSRLLVSTYPKFVAMVADSACRAEGAVFASEWLLGAQEDGDDEGDVTSSTSVVGREDCPRRLAELVFPTNVNSLLAHFFALFQQPGVLWVLLEKPSSGSKPCDAPLDAISPQQLAEAPLQCGVALEEAAALASSFGIDLNQLLPSGSSSAAAAAVRTAITRR